MCLLPPGSCISIFSITGSLFMLDVFTSIKCFAIYVLLSNQKLDKSKEFLVGDLFSRLALWLVVNNSLSSLALECHQFLMPGAREHMFSGPTRTLGLPMRHWWQALSLVSDGDRRVNEGFPVPPMLLWHVREIWLVSQLLWSFSHCWFVWHCTWVESKLFCLGKSVRRVNIIHEYFIQWYFKTISKVSDA